MALKFWLLSKIISEMNRKVDNYPIFSLWVNTLDWILDMAEKLPRSVRFSLGKRLMVLSLENIELIVEAIYSKDRKPKLVKMNLNLEKLRILIRLCHARRYISAKQYAYISAEINKTGKMCGGWLNA